MEFPKGTDMMPPGGPDALLGAFYIVVFGKSKLKRKGGV